MPNSKSPIQIPDRSEYKESMFPTREVKAYLSANPAVWFLDGVIELDRRAQRALPDLAYSIGIIKYWHNYNQSVLAVVHGGLTVDRTYRSKPSLENFLTALLYSKDKHLDWFKGRLQQLGMVQRNVTISSIRLYFRCCSGNDGITIKMVSSKPWRFQLEDINGKKAVLILQNDKFLEKNSFFQMDQEGFVLKLIKLYASLKFMPIIMEIHTRTGGDSSRDNVISIQSSASYFEQGIGWHYQIYLSDTGLIPATPIAGA